MTFGLSKNAVKQFNDLYCLHGETIDDSFKRVAKEFATNEEEEKLAYNLLAENIWRPNTPVWLNAGTNHKIFSACFVSELQDSMDSIYDIANVARKIFQFGSGIGIPIGNLREAEAYIYEGNIDMVPEGRTSGPLTFAKLFDAVGETTKSGGRVRRAAILLLMLCWHPDILDFIKCKQIDGQLSNMNISVGITDKFMQCLEDKVPFDLLTPYNGSKVGEIDPQELWDELYTNAHAHAEPGIVFIDNVNKWNPLIKKILIECCNPCGEQFLIPFGACNLSAINIAKFVEGQEFDWKTFYRTVFNVMGFMNNLIDVMEFPDIRYKENTLKYRPVGIGPMGLADAMYKLGLKYDGPDGRKFAGEIMKTMTTACAHKSALIAKEKGSFFEYDIHKENMERIIDAHIDSNEEVMELVKKYGVANIQFTTAQPTGTTALSCDASYGIEPMFGLVFQKNYIDGNSGIVANPVFKEKYKNESWFTDDLLDKIENNKGSLKGLHGIPKDVREVFVVAHDIKWKDRIDMQSELQKYCSNAISSTVNLPAESTKEEVSDMFKYAYKKGLKGLTIYRDGSKKGQPVTFEHKEDLTNFTRPKRLISNTYIVETGNGKMYVTVCDYKGKPLEIFIHIGKSGQILNTFTESLGRVISIAFQNGVPVEEITKTLININSDKPTWFRFEETDKKPDQILSIPDGIAKLLNRYYTGMEYKGELSFEICEMCGSSMNATEGCFSCPSCGHSKCS